MKRPFSRSRVSLSLFAFTAAAAVVLVNVVDPYSGATASPYFQIAGDRFEGQAVQAVDVAGTYTNTITRDGFAVTMKPKPVVVATPATSAYSVASAAVPDPGSAKAIALAQVNARGWGNDQYSCLVALWNRESGWRVNAANKSSGAYGIPQALPGSKMASAGSDWATNPATQIKWGLGYISGRYGTPCGAWAHSENSGWY